MAVLLVTPRRDEASTWERLLRERIPEIDFEVHPGDIDAAKVEIALAWRPPRGLLAGFPRLRLICSLGMGVDHLLEDPTLPDVPITRLVDPAMTEQLSEYALYAVLHYHRRFDEYARLQHERDWKELPLTYAHERNVGVMGLGVVGLACAERLFACGFRVSGWSRRPKALPGMRCLHGEAGLRNFLATAEILLVTLPLTAQTRGILDRRTLERLPGGAYVINIARGDLVVERDLLAALDSDRLAGAFLDVFQREPLPAGDPLWRHPKVRITPHVAGITDPRSAVDAIADNIRRLWAGQPLRDLIDREAGY